MDKAEFARKAKELGADCVYYIEPCVYDMSDSIARCEGDPFALLPETKCVAAIVLKYSPYAACDDGQPAPTASYAMSHKAFGVADALVRFLRDSGFAALNAPKLPVKSVLCGAGVAAVGLNSLAAIEGIGTRFVAQTILTDAFEPDEKYFSGKKCINCNICVKSCPVGAIDEKNGLNPRDCMRYHMGGSVMPDEVKRNVRTIFGCEICQQVCPNNAHVEYVGLSESVKRLFTFEGIFEYSDITKKELAAQFGKNMLTHGRVRAQAMCIAANMENNAFGAEAEMLKIGGTPCEADAANYYLSKLKKPV